MIEKLNEDKIPVFTSVHIAYNSYFDQITDYLKRGLKADEIWKTYLYVYNKKIIHFKKYEKEYDSFYQKDFDIVSDDKEMILYRLKTGSYDKYVFVNKKLLEKNRKSVNIFRNDGFPIIFESWLKSLNKGIKCEDGKIKGYYVTYKSQILYETIIKSDAENFASDFLSNLKSKFNFINLQDYNYEKYLSIREHDDIVPSDQKKEKFYDYVIKLFYNNTPEEWWDKHSNMFRGNLHATKLGIV